MPADGTSRRRIIHRTRQWLIMLLGLLIAAMPAFGEALASDDRVVVTYGAARQLPADFLGINAEMVNPTADPQLWQALGQLHMQHLRYPGGGAANYWDWARGWLDPKLDANRLLSWMHGLQNSAERFPLEALAALHRQNGVSVLFVLNVVTDSLEAQIAHLKRAEALGIPIQRVELGNELYMDIEPYVLERFPTVQAYAEEANRWAAALRAAFPAVQIAVVGAARNYAPQTSRVGSWNRRLFPLLSEAVTAVAEHLYIDGGIGPQVAPNGTGWGTPTEQQAQHDALQTPEGVAKLLSRPFQAWADFQLFSDLSDKHALWMTEFSLFDWNGPVRGTWASGLVVGGFIHAFLQDVRVELATYHSFGGGPLFAAVFPNATLWNGLTTAKLDVPPYALTAAGVVLSVFGQATHGMETVTALNFTPNTTIQGTRMAAYPALWGWQFQGAGRRSVVLVNYAAQPVTAQMTTLTVVSLPYQQLYGQPAAYVLGRTSLQMAEGNVESEFTLPPYSITIIEDIP